jgi:alpha-2-macroglobulin
MWWSSQAPGSEPYSLTRRGRVMSQRRRSLPIFPLKLRTLVQPKAIYFPDYEDFSFGGEDIHEGIEHVAGADSYFPEAGGTRLAQPRPAQVLPLKLDWGGAARATIMDLPNIATAHEIVVELEYQDTNGEILTAANRIDLWPAKINLGIRMEGWAATEEHVKFQVITLDLRGKPMADQSIAVDLFRRTTYSHRKRLISGFYGYESMTETKRIGEACQGPPMPGGCSFVM